MSTTITHSAKEFADAIQKQVKQDVKDSLYAAQQALNNTAFKAREKIATFSPASVRRASGVRW